MKSNYILSAIALFLLTACSTDDEARTTGEDLCLCKKVYYEYTITGWANGGVSPIWGYVRGDEETATERDCADDTGEYVQIDANDYYKIECE